jgi:hypothetical protein
MATSDENRDDASGPADVSEAYEKLRELARVIGRQLAREEALGGGKSSGRSQVCARS